MKSKLTPQAKALYIVPFKKLKTSKAWKTTSLLVRLKSKGVCYTCGRRYPIEKLNAGHFREKIGNAGTYFDLDNLRAQCYSCNRPGRGMKDIYATKLVKDLGPDILSSLLKRSQKARVWTVADLEKITEERLPQVKQLLG